VVKIEKREGCKYPRFKIARRKRWPVATKPQQ